MIRNPNKTKALVVSRSKTVNPPHGDFVLSGVCICASPNLDILHVKFDSRLTFEDHVRGIVSRVSQKIGILGLVKLVFEDTTVLLRCYYAFVVFNPWVLFSGVGVYCWMSSPASWAPGVFGGQAFPWSDFLVVVSSTSCCCNVSVVQGQFDLESLFVQWASFSFGQSSKTCAAAAAHPLEFEVSRCRTSKFAGCFFSLNVFDTRTLDGFKGAVNRWLLPWVCFSVFRGAGACWIVLAIYKHFYFSHLGLCCWF